MNEINTSTTLEEIEEAFIYKDISIKNLNRNLKTDVTPMTLVTFSIFTSSNRAEVLKTGLAVYK